MEHGILHANIVCDLRLHNDCLTAGSCCDRRVRNHRRDFIQRRTHNHIRGLGLIEIRIDDGEVVVIIHALFNIVIGVGKLVRGDYGCIDLYETLFCSWVIRIINCCAIKVKACECLIIILHPAQLVNAAAADALQRHCLCGILCDLEEETCAVLTGDKPAVICCDSALCTDIHSAHVDKRINREGACPLSVGNPVALHCVIRIWLAAAVRHRGLHVLCHIAVESDVHCHSLIAVYCVDAVSVGVCDKGFCHEGVNR